MHHMNHNYCPLLSYYLPFIVEEIDSEKFNDLSKVAKRMSGRSRFPTHRAKLQTLKYLLYFYFYFSVFYLSLSIVGDFVPSLLPLAPSKIL